MNPWPTDARAPRRQLRRSSHLSWLLAGWCLLGLAPLAAAQSEPFVFNNMGTHVGFPDEADPNRQVLVLLGGVEVVQGDRRLLGDVIVAIVQRGGPSPAAAARPAADSPAGATIVPSEKVLELLVDGEVTFEQGNEQIVGAQSVYIDNVRGTVTILQGEWRSSQDDTPLIVRYQIMRQLQDGIREMEGVSVSTCEYAHSHWSMDTPWARLVPTANGRVLHTSWNSVHVGGLPVLWLPALHMNVDRERPPLKRLGFGTSNKYGTEVDTEWGGDASDMLTGVGRLMGVGGPVKGEWELELNNYSSRGLFVQPGWAYETEHSAGRVFGSSIHDRNHRDSLDQPIRDDTRGRFDLQHRTTIDDRRVVDAEVSYISDSGFLEEYYPQEATVGKEQETYVNYRDVVDNQAFEVLARTRLNRFDTQVEYLPQVVQRTAGLAVDTGPFGTGFFTSRQFADSARLAAEELQASDFGQPTPSQPDGFNNIRAGSDGVMRWPIDVGGDRVVVSAGYDLTGFDRSQDVPDNPATTTVDERDVDETGLVRSAAFGGVEWSRTYSGTADYHSDTWNLDGIRQIVEPRIGYSGVFEQNHGPEDFEPIDDTEKLKEIQAFIVGVRHRTQTHQRRQVVTIWDGEVFMPIYPDQDRDNNGQTNGPVTVDARWRPGADIFGLRNGQFRWRAHVDPADWQFIDTFSSYSTTLGPDRRFSVAHDAAHDISEFITAGMEWDLTPTWSFAVFTQQDLLLHQTSRLGVLLRQFAHRWIIDIEASQRRGRSTTSTQDANRDDTQIALRLSPAFGPRDETLLAELGRIR